MKGTSWSQGLSVTADGDGVVPLAGLVAVRLLADRVGLTQGLSAALARRGFIPGHDRGRVWVDVATMLTAGGEAIADIDTLRHQAGLLGSVASAPTVWRTMDEATPSVDGPQQLAACTIGCLSTKARSARSSSLPASPPRACTIRPVHRVPPVCSRHEAPTGSTHPVHRRARRRTPTSEAGGPSQVWGRGRGRSGNGVARAGRLLIFGWSRAR